MPIAGESALRVQFFDLIFGANEGFICIASNISGSPQSTFKQHFFLWPDEHTLVEELIVKEQKKRNVWFCVNLLAKRQRTKLNCLPTDLVWADLDHCHPNKVVPNPAIIIESSPKRYQALWRLESIVDAEVAEDYSKRIAYSNRVNGADVTGWDLTQLLRVPLTKNWKYSPQPRVRLERALEIRVPNAIFEGLPIPTPTGDSNGEEPLPDIENLIHGR